MKKHSLALLLALLMLTLCAAPALADEDPAFIPQVKITEEAGSTTVTVSDRDDALAILQPSLTVAWTGSSRVKITGPDGDSRVYTARSGQVTFTVYQAGAYRLTVAPASQDGDDDDDAPITTPSVPATPADVPVVSYSDISQGDWFYAYVAELSAAGVIHGYPDGSFRPAGAVTYGEALKLILLAAGYAEQPATAAHWAGGYLAKAQADGLIGAVADLNAPIDRLTVAQIAAKALGLAAPARDSAFADTADEAVRSLYEAGIVEGGFNAAGQRLYKPGDPITRAEITAIIWRIHQHAEN